MNNPAIFDGRKVTTCAASNILRRRDHEVYDEVANIVRPDDAPFCAVLYGEDLGASVSLILDLRSDQVIYFPKNTSPELVEKWANVIRLLHSAEVLFDEEMSSHA